MIVLAIDPGNEQSAYVKYDGERPTNFGKVPNDFMRTIVKHQRAIGGVLAIEMIASYGMPVGREVFETCLAIGRYLEIWGDGAELVYRRDVKLHLCNSARAKDGNVRAALIDRFGGKATAIGKKLAPGPLWKVSADVWAALAVAVTYADTRIARAA